MRVCHLHLHWLQRYQYWSVGMKVLKFIVKKVYEIKNFYNCCKNDHYNIGIKHGFSCINICQVPWEMLKTQTESLMLLANPTTRNKKKKKQKKTNKKNKTKKTNKRKKVTRNYLYSTLLNRINQKEKI